jgi:hypothetical protein
VTPTASTRWRPGLPARKRPRPPARARQGVAALTQNQADGRIFRGEVVSLPVLAMNYGEGIAVYAGESSSIDAAKIKVWAMGFQPLTYDHRATPQVWIQSSYSIVAGNGVTYNEWIEVPVAAKVIAE